MTQRLLLKCYCKNEEQKSEIREAARIRGLSVSQYLVTTALKETHLSAQRTGGLQETAQELQFIIDRHLALNDADIENPTSLILVAMLQEILVAFSSHKVQMKESD